MIQRDRSLKLLFLNLADTLSIKSRTFISALLLPDSPCSEASTGETWHVPLAQVKTCSAVLQEIYGFIKVCLK